MLIKRRRKTSNHFYSNDTTFYAAKMDWRGVITSMRGDPFFAFRQAQEERQTKVRKIRKRDEFGSYLDLSGLG
jgi:hypothetical protein